ncbi:hypothetical protein [Porphyromonas circumdentaria]|uniref:hypothetical protein n=1 Tax=Porphyromonas circumdentaria TaxID=29524 RepID=UPI0026DCAD4D|nr:hypothetical protein [Porphyromonas circumdentaria]MDO4722522.1 hypothetical protein [Porphyromonas circumdentaria]
MTNSPILPQEEEEAFAFASHRFKASHYALGRIIMELSSSHLFRNIETANQNNTEPVKRQAQKKAKLSSPYRTLNIYMQHRCT